jgi:hypothetical protein
MTDGIHIPREVADAEGVPEELDAGIVGQYRFPDPRRRRIAGWIYLGTAVVLAGLASQQSLVWGGVALAGLLGIWHLVSAWPLVMDQEQALAKAATVVDFPVGHSSAAVTFVGVRSRPRWHVVMYSADEPPSQRALVQFDGVSGDLAEDVYTEDVPKVDDVS